MIEQNCLFVLIPLVSDITILSLFNPNSTRGGEGGGHDRPCDAKIVKIRVLNNKPALIKQISLFDTAFIMTNTIQSKKKNVDQSILPQYDKG